jgi:hypothetical protein
MGVSGQRHAPAALLPPGKGPPVPIGQEAGWAPEKEEKSFCLCRGLNLYCPVVQPIHPSNGAIAQIGPWPPLSGLLLYSVTIMFYGMRLLASRPTPVNFGEPMVFCRGLLP